MRFAARYLLVLVVLAGAASSRAADGGLGAGELFRYDERAPLDVKELGRERRGEVLVRDIAFSVGSPNRRVRAYLVTPPGEAKAAGILFVHWLGEQRSDRTEFLDEAVALASRGAVGLLVDAMWSAPKWFETRTCDGDWAASLAQVVSLRRALDVLVAQPNVDPSRIGFVGHDFGAMYGVVMGAADRRPKTYVLMAPTAHFSDWYLLGAPPKSREAYVKKMAELDPTRFLGQLAPATVYLQFAKNDRYVTAQQAAELVAAAPAGKLSHTYDLGHEMGARSASTLEAKQGLSDRYRWLAKELSLAR